MFHPGHHTLPVGTCTVYLVSASGAQSKAVAWPHHGLFSAMNNPRCPIPGSSCILYLDPGPLAPSNNSMRPPAAIIVVLAAHFATRDELRCLLVTGRSRALGRYYAREHSCLKHLRLDAFPRTGPPAPSIRNHASRCLFRRSRSVHQSPERRSPQLALARARKSC